MSASVERKRVVIIGAGASGIAASTRLYENGIRDIILLEAENRIGGRVETVEIEDGVIEMGAQWIHGEQDNIVYELAAAHKLACDPPSHVNTTMFARSSGELIEPQFTKKMHKIVQKILEPSKTGTKSFKNCGEYYVHSLKTELNKIENADIPDEIKSEFMEFCHQLINSWDASDTWFNTSISNLEEIKWCEGSQTVMWNGSGYRALFNILMKKSQELSNGSFTSDVIALNTEVERISLNDHQDSSITVECSDGRIILADHVIITVSVGVLRETHTKLFENMPIPELKIRSINNLEFGTVDKMFIEFSKPWWPKDCRGFELLWTKQDRERYAEKGLGWILDMFAVVAVNFAPNALCGWITGASARIMESLDERFVLETVMQALREFLGEKWEIPDAVRLIRSTWYTNKHFRGSYSYRGLRTEDANVSAYTLSTPVKNSKGTPVLLFAGEATSPHSYSFVHGAVESGFREADRLMPFLKKP